MIGRCVVHHAHGNVSAHVACSTHDLASHSTAITILICPAHNCLAALQAVCIAAAVAPAGSFIDKGVGKLCVKGTYTTSLSNASVCTPCSTGITTSTDGSTSAANCSYALPGYKKMGSNLASLCPLHTYSANESDSGSCTPCPHSESYSMAAVVMAAGAQSVQPWSSRLAGAVMCS